MQTAALGRYGEAGKPRLRFRDPDQRALERGRLLVRLIDQPPDGVDAPAQLLVVRLDDRLHLCGLLLTGGHELAEGVGLDTDSGADVPLDLVLLVLGEVRRHCGAA